MNKFNEVIKENQKRYNERQQANKIVAKREKIKEQILTGIIICFILTITCMLLNSYSDKQVENCMEKGYSENVCISNT